jgi:hypothetical protein
MNAKQLLIAAALAAIGSAAMAAEVAVFATEFPSANASTLSRAEVKAELDQARTHHELMNNYVGDVRGERQATTLRSRDDVRAEAREEARSASHYRSFDIGN